MPLVLVSVDRENPELSDPFLSVKILSEKLCDYVAEALGCDELELSPRDIEVQVRDRRREDCGNPKFGLQIVVFAHNFSSRLANLEDRVRQLKGLITNYLQSKNVHGFIWVLLCPGAFESF